ncbi:MAG: hypothetical protein JST77_02545 [Acidobacteria bacterium]|nr:hypothetical protein [Acidobacteriota bacterium]
MAAIVVLGFIVAAVYLFSKVANVAIVGVVGGAVAGFVASVALKSYEFRKQHEALIAEKKREVYSRLLAPWIQTLVRIKDGKTADDMLVGVDLSGLYASSFDTVLYGSESVLRRYVQFRCGEEGRDSIDTLRDFANLLIAMREDITSQKSFLSEEAVLRTFVNLQPEERVVLQLREYAARMLSRAGQSSSESDAKKQS